MPRFVLAFSMVVLQACAAGSSGPSGVGPASDSPSRGEGSPSGAPMVQPGAPGEATRSIDVEALDELGGVAWTEADVRFMQGMIPHHAQALEMTALVERHATTEAVRQMALRMEISQRDEIALMERWLRERDQAVPDWREGMEHGVARSMSMGDGASRGDPAGAGHDDHSAGAGTAGDGMAGMAMMPGMLTPAQMERLRAARGPEFDRLFLESMIQHHEGAIVMVRELFTARGGGQESEIFQFASHVDADQTAEIERMRGVLERLR
jgi:uncharacterized protein (DUF305 family)